MVQITFIYKRVRDFNEDLRALRVAIHPGGSAESAIIRQTWAVLSSDMCPGAES
jgi:cob(I)alamin adenosyltransferase